MWPVGGLFSSDLDFFSFSFSLGIKIEGRSHFKQAKISQGDFAFYKKEPKV